MKIYLAGQYKQKPELKDVALLLASSGHVVTSHWLDEPYSPNVTLAELSESAMREIAEFDLNDIHQADAIMFASVSADEATKRGGRHVEFGYALANDKRMMVVGPRENIFHYLSDIEVYPTWQAAISALESR